MRRGGTRVSRAEKSEAIRRALLEAAVTVVGRFGYAGASIARITMSAEVAQGTFYNYFESRDELFSHLLPEIGKLMVTEIADKVRAEKGFAAREEARIRAYLQFLRSNPGFYRVLREAETFAPEAHREHMNNMVAGYVRALRAERQRAGAPRVSDSEIEKMVYMLLGARDYLAMRLSVSPQRAAMAGGATDDETVRTYMRAIRGGLFDDVPDRAG
ncbi:MAG: TetR/AcrR family transcriptional regulator [Alphaproteobacteria bacterium]|nr:TetR/AcrR family transcriptional regulator [Alphaproteobacteria bacterium]